MLVLKSSLWRRKDFERILKFVSVLKALPVRLRARLLQGFLSQQVWTNADRNLPLGFSPNPLRFFDRLWQPLARDEGRLRLGVTRVPTPYRPASQCRLAMHRIIGFQKWRGREAAANFARRTSDARATALACLRLL